MHKLTSLAHGAVRKALGLFSFLFVLSLVLTGTASAQVVQPSYVRPSKGAPIVLATVTATSTMATYTTSAIFDWSAFAGVVITADITSGPTGTFTACRYGARVKSLGGTSTAGNFFLLNVANNDYQAATSQSWYVRVLPTYLRFTIGTYEAAASGQPSCTYKITATPLPFDYAGQLVSTGVVGTYAASNNPEDPYSPAVVTSVPTFTYTRVQNIDSSGLAYCKPVLSDGTVPNPAQYLQWPIQLEPYQAVEINNWVGTIHCIGIVGIFAH
jgi:hypothetical protein